MYPKDEHHFEIQQYVLFLQRILLLHKFSYILIKFDGMHM